MLYFAAMASIKTFSDKQKAFIKARAHGKGPQEAAKIAGYSCPEKAGYEYEKQPHIIAAVQKEFKRAERVADMDKKRVMDGILDAIDQAKLMSEPMTQIAGWREVAKMCGYYEPTKVQLDVSVSAKRLFSKFETMSDEELLRLAETEIIEVEDFEVLDGDGTTQEEARRISSK